MARRRGLPVEGAGRRLWHTDARSVLACRPVRVAVSILPVLRHNDQEDHARQQHHAPAGEMANMVKSELSLRWRTLAGAIRSFPGIEYP